MLSRNVPAGKYLSRDPKQGYYILGKTGLRLHRRNLPYTQADFVVGIKQSVHEYKDALENTQREGT